MGAMRPKAEALGYPILLEYPILLGYPILLEYPILFGYPILLGYRIVGRACGAAEEQRWSVCEAWVGEQQAYEFAAGVATDAEDGRLELVRQ
jgi:hypothetical protein